MLLKNRRGMNSARSMNKNRGSLDIAYDMLSIASVKARKTRIMYGANLNFLQVEKYLRDLLGSGLLKRDGDSSYLVTEAGLEFLKLYKAYLEQSARLSEEVEMDTKNRKRLENMCFTNKNKTNQTEKDDLQ